MLSPSSLHPSYLKDRNVPLDQPIGSLKVAKLMIEDFVKWFAENNCNPNLRYALIPSLELLDSDWSELVLHARNLGFNITRKATKIPPKDSPHRRFIITVFAGKVQDKMVKSA